MTAIRSAGLAANVCDNTTIFSSIVTTRQQQCQNEATCQYRFDCCFALRSSITDITISGVAYKLLLTFFNACCSINNTLTYVGAHPWLGTGAIYTTIHGVTPLLLLYICITEKLNQNIKRGIEKRGEKGDKEQRRKGG